MAESGLSGALRPVTNLPDVDSGDEYANTIAKLKASLDARQNRIFNPELLALAQGFLAPTATGSFGESLGQAAGAYSKAANEEEKRAQENASLRLQIAQSEREQRNKDIATQEFLRLTGGKTKKAPTGEQAAPVSGEQPQEGSTQQPLRKLTMSDALRMTTIDKDLGKALAEAVKFESERYKIAQNGTVFDTVEGRYIDMPIPGQVASKFSVPEVGGELSMTPNQFAEYQKAREKGLGKEWVKDFMSPGGGKKSMPVSSASAYSSEEPSVDMSVSGQEARAKAKIAEAETVAKGRGENTVNAINTGNASEKLIPTIRTIQTIIKDPETTKITGIFENPDIASAIGKMVEEGVSLGRGFQIAMPQIREVLTNYNIDPALIEKAQILGMMYAQLQFQARSLAKGQGAISDKETTLFGSVASPSMKDLRGTVEKKAQMLEQRALFDTQVRNALLDNDVSYDKFVRSKEYQRMKDAYENKLTSIVAPEFATKPSKTLTPKAGASSSSNRGEELRNLLGFK